MKLRESNIKRAIKQLFLKKKKNLVLLEPRPGLGDSIICAGLVKALSLRHPDTFFYYACTGKNTFHTISWILANNPNVYPVQTSGGKEARQLADFWNCQHWEIGINNLDYMKFDQHYYSQYQIPFSKRWDYGSITPGPKAYNLLKELNPNEDNFILVCDMRSSNQNYALTISNPKNLRIIKVFPATQNLCDWLLLAKKASEIHTVDTSFIHLVESFFYNSTDHPELHFHLARRAGTEFTRKLPWKTIYYPLLHQEI